jgi:hypothetical protein
LNQDAAERKPACCSGRVLDVHARDRTTDNLSDRLGEGGHLTFKFRARRNLFFEDGNENRQLRRIESRIILRISIARKGVNPNPGLSGRRFQRAANSVGKRLRNIRRHRVCASDNFDGHDWHAA